MSPNVGALTPLLDPLRNLGEVQKAIRGLQSQGHYAISGAPRSVLSTLVATLFTGSEPEAQRQLLLLTSHPDTAGALADELQFWLPASTPVLLFPALEGLPYERTAAEPSIVQGRQQALELVAQGSSVVVVAPIRAVLQPLMEPPRFRSLRRTIQVDGRFAVQAETGVWQTMGYQAVPVVQAPGQFSRRGGIVDVFPAGASWPVRIELLGSEVASLRQFDPATQRSVAPLAVVTLVAVHPFVLPAQAQALSELRALDCSRCLPHVQTQWQEELQLLERGVLFEGLEFYTPYLNEPSASLLSYFSSSVVVVVDQPGDCRRLAKELIEQSEELVEELVGRGEAPPGLRMPLLSEQSIWQEIALLPQLQWFAQGGEGRADWGATRVFSTAPSYAGSLKRFVQDCDELRQKQERVCIISLQSQRLVELLREEGVPVTEVPRFESLPPRGSITAAPCQLPEGWLAPDAHLVVFTDAEVAGWSRPRPVARFHRESGSAFALDFLPGDYVVHIEHGIGRYQGVARMGSGRAEKEYLDLQFSGTDRLYVPTDQLDRVTKYRGITDAPPALSRLGTQEWTRAKAKVKESVEAIARELFALYQFREKAAGHAFAEDGHWQRELEAAFPYEETPDQDQAIRDVKADMERSRPMDRLVCGDVGYGKTEVALRAAFKAVMDGRQVAVLVPTTVLAQQHYNTFRERMQAFPVRIGVLSRFHSRAEQQRVVDGIRDGVMDIVIGTHRLLQKDIAFKDLGLLVIDEEQRFGVKHKEQLKQFRRDIDVLTLTATPIPRSLHMGLMRVRDLSIIATPPEGRLPIKTFLEPFDEYHIREALLREIDRGGQVYFVHNRVQTIEAMMERLRRLAPHARLAVAHGQMPEAELERVMFDFAAGTYDVLVCSTIIENGLDIPNVNTMIVHEATNFGLSQLYQLRGRIGRGSKRGYAYLLYNPNTRITRTAERRLKAIFESTELGAGFQIALKDLEIRGAGNVLGAAQHGHMAAVGFQLYATMLQEAIEVQREGKAEAQPVRAQATISLPVDAYLPAEYVEDENQRLRLYQRLAGISEVKDIDDLESEIRDRFGPLPEAVLTMLATVRIRLKALQLGISKVSLDPEALVIQGTYATLYDRMAVYARYGASARIDRGVLRLPARALGKSPIGEVEDILNKALVVTLQSQQPTAAPMSPAKSVAR